MKCLRWIVKAILAGYLLLLAALSVPALLGFQIYAVVSGSMSPGIPVGAAVYVGRAGFEQIRVGDVITYAPESGSVKVTHRVIKKDEEHRSFTTKGDANSLADGREVPYETVSGVVRFCVPCLGYASALLGNAGIKILLGGILAWLFVINNILASMLEMREKGVTTI